MPHAAVQSPPLSAACWLLPSVMLRTTPRQALSSAPAALSWAFSVQD